MQLQQNQQNIVQKTRQNELENQGFINFLASVDKESCEIVNER